MNGMRICAGFVWLSALLAIAQSAGDTSVRDGWVTVAPPAFDGAINNPLKGFRAHKKGGYGLLERTYIKWSEIEVCADDTVERVMAHTTRIPAIKGRRFEDLNVKLEPGRYRFACLVRGTPGLTVALELADDWRKKEEERE
jgi:hypothetical protein